MNTDDHRLKVIGDLSQMITDDGSAVIATPHPANWVWEKQSHLRSSVKTGILHEICDNL